MSKWQLDLYSNCHFVIYRTMPALLPLLAEFIAIIGTGWGAYNGLKRTEAEEKLKSAGIETDSDTKILGIDVKKVGNVVMAVSIVILLIKIVNLFKRR